MRERLVKVGDGLFITAQLAEREASIGIGG